MEQITGYVERITFQSDESGYTVAKIQLPKKRELTTVVGLMAGLTPGVTICCNGEWKQHLVHGKQFEINDFHIKQPADVVGIERYLGSGLVKGIGPVNAKNIVAHFGLETLKIIDNDPKRLLEVPGLGQKKLDLIRDSWTTQSAIREVMIFLQKHEVSPALSQKIFKKYGKESIDKLQKNPYCVARDLHGFGFKTADTIAAKLGISRESPQRIEAGIEYVLNQLATEGHTCYPLHQYMIYAAEMLEVPSPLIDAQLETLCNEERIVVGDLPYQGELLPFIWIKALRVSEEGIAKDLQRLLYSPSYLRRVDKQKAIDWVEKTLKITLAENQKKAVATALSAKVQIITGGPGTGKSTITNAILSVTAKLTHKIVLAAPTGRAAKRMSEITGKKASTIHSLLQVDFARGGFKKNRQDPIDCDLIIIDEASMIDTPLMFHLLKAIPSHARVIFVGDINQLPSVGPGNVLKNLIEAKLVPITQLNEIFRQAAHSQIVTNAHKINQGVMPEVKPQSDGDFFFLEAENPQTVLKTIVNLLTHRLPKKYGFNPKLDIQVLAPMKRGPIGTFNLNEVLQQTLNPRKEHLYRAGQKFAIGDKVMQLRNNHKQEVYNGDVGWITKIDQSEQEMIVSVDGREVVYPFQNLDELTLAYAVSVHKYQGSECPCIVMPIHPSHSKLLRRNLLYTAVTRGKKIVVLVGTQKALSIAVYHDDVAHRYTALKQTIITTSTQRITECLA